MKEKKRDLSDIAIQVGIISVYSGVIIGFGWPLLSNHLIPLAKGFFADRSMEPTSTKDEALADCFKRLEADLEESLADKDQSLFKSSKYTERKILRTYCKPHESRTKDLFSYLGWVEYVETPLDGLGESEIQNVVITYSGGKYFRFD